MSEQDTQHFEFGAIPSPVDERDWSLASVGAGTTYPDSCFIEQDFMYSNYQKNIGCCVGCTGEAVVRKIVYELTGVQEEGSFRFVYALAKCLEGTVYDGVDYRMYGRTGGANDGTYPALVAKVIRKYGVPLAKYCPNDVDLSPEAFCYGRDIKNIPAEAFTDALKRRSGADFAVPCTEDGIKQAITYAKANNGGVMILRRIGKTYWTGADGKTTWDKNKLLPLRPTRDIVSGHEEFLYGYDTEAKTNRVRIHWANSWSDKWADKGRAWEYLDEWLGYIGEIRVVVASVGEVKGFTYTFNNNLELGSQGADVVALQHALKIKGHFTHPTFTGYFGPVTKAAVIAYQTKNKIDPIGVVGPKTRASLNAEFSK